MLSTSIRTLIVCGVWAGVSCKPKPTAVVTSNRVPEHHAPPAQSSIAADDWKRIDLKAFSFSLPPSVKEKKVRGTDSIVWKYTDDSIELVIELSLYSGKPWVYTTKPEYREAQIEIGGKQAEMIFFRSDDPPLREQPYVAAVYLSEVGSQEAQLSFIVYSNSRRGQEVAEAIFRSISFPESAPAKSSTR